VARRYGAVTHVRFSAEELAILKAIAEREGVTVSEVIRRLVRAETGHLPVASEALLPGILDKTDQLRRVGLNFNQAVRAMNEGRIPYDEDLEGALIAVGDLVRQFREELKAMTIGSRKARKAKP
jgi:predicted DNA-binding ribbon-helix-helix protein